MRIIGIAIAYFLFVSPSFAGDTIEVIPLKHKVAADLIPVIEPLLQPGEAVSGKQKQIVISASQERIDKLRSVVEQLDSQIQQLRVTVRRASPQEIEEIQDQNETSVRIYGTRRQAENSDQYTVTTLNGSAAFIQTGVSIPLPGNGAAAYSPHIVATQIVSPLDLIPTGITYKDTSSGVFILPELRGNVVTLYVTSQREAFATTGSHQINRNAIMTTVRGQLGTWISLGGTSDSIKTDPGRIYSTGAREEDKTTWWIMAERL